MKKLFAMAAFVVAAMSANAQLPEGVTAHAPVVPWGALAEINITNDLTEQVNGNWQLTQEAQQWIQYEYDGAVTGTIQQTNRPNVWYDFYSETTVTIKEFVLNEEGNVVLDENGNKVTQDKEISCDDMLIGDEANNWRGYLTVTSKTGSTSGLMVVGKARFPRFYVTATDKAKFYFSGSAGTAGYPQIEVKDVATGELVATKTGDIALTKSTWDKSTLLIADGLDKSKTYEITARTMDANGAYEGGDIVLQVVKFYGDQAPLREDNLIISGSELSSYIAAYREANPEAYAFELEGNGKYTVTGQIRTDKGFSLKGVAAAPATIDAGDNAFIVLRDNVTPATNADGSENANYTYADKVELANLKINGLSKALVQNSTQKTYVENITIDNVVAQFGAGSYNIFNFSGGGYPGNLSVKKSTLYSAPDAEHKGYFLQTSGRVKDLDSDQTTFKQVIDIENSTLSNIAFGQQANNLQGKGQQSLRLILKSNILNNFGSKSGAIVRGWHGGQQIASDNFIYDKNTYIVADTINTDWTTGNGADLTETALTTVPFTNGTNFNVPAKSQQAKFQTGDPRWLVPYATDAIKLEVDQSENTDFIAAINAALETSEAPSSIEVSFWEAGEYPTTGELNTNSPIRFLNGSDIDAGEATIVVKNGFKLGGAVEFNGVNIDASQATEAIVTFQGNPYKLQSNDFYDLGAVKFLNLKVSGLTKPLVKTGGTKVQLSELAVENSIIQIGAIGGEIAFDFKSGGVANSFNIKKSTIYADPASEASLYSSQSGSKATDAGLSVQNFAIDNSTIVNVTKGKNFFTHRQSNQTWLAYYLRNNVFVNVGKSGQVVKGVNQGQSGKNPKWTVSGNLFNFDGVDTSADESTGDDEEPVQNSIAGVIEFTDLAGADFSGVINLAEGQEAPATAPGDPRWAITFVEAAQPAGDVTYALVEGDTFTSGQIVEVKGEDGSVVATIQYGEEGGADFNAAVADNHVDGYTASTGGNGQNGNKAGGTFYTIVPNYDGVISVAVVLNADKKFHLVVDGEQNATFDNNTVSEKYYGNVAFNVEGGKSYKFYCDGSKLGFYGFNYKFGPDVEAIEELSVAEQQATTGIETIDVVKANNGIVYNLNGQQVQNAQKGLYIINGKKVVLK